MYAPTRRGSSDSEAAEQLLPWYPPTAWLQWTVPMRRVTLLLHEMVEAGVITNYALFGAVAQIRYTELVATLDADVLVSVPSPERSPSRHLTISRTPGSGLKRGSSMTDVRGLLERQADWQRALRRLSWPEMLRMAAKLRCAVLNLHRSKRDAPSGKAEGGGPPGA
jgi:hypothetical protein